MQLTLIALSTTLALTGQAGPETRDPGVIGDCLVTLIDEVLVPADLPAQQGGVLMDLILRDAEGKEILDQSGRPVLVREGIEVQEGWILGRVDDRMSQKQLEVSIYRREVAEKEAENDVSVRYAEKAHQVAEAERDQGYATNAKVPGAVPAVELRRLYLQVEQFKLQIEQARHELAIAAKNLEVRKAEVAAAELDVDRRQIKAPVSGVIVEVFPHVGEWLRAGDPMLKVVGMQRLRVEGFLDATRIVPAQVDKKPVNVYVPLAGGGSKPFKGQIVFVDPQVERGKRFMVWAEVENERQDGHYLLRPGMMATMEIEWRRPSGSGSLSQTAR